MFNINKLTEKKALINSIVTPRMTFTKTSQKFGQWIDFKLNLVYGLGFSNDVELNKVKKKTLIDKQIFVFNMNKIFNNIFQLVCR